MAKKGLKGGQEGKEEYWKGHIDEWNRSGSSQAEYCRRHKLSPKSFTYWKRRMRQQEPVSFIPVQVKPSVHKPSDNSTGVVLCKEEYRIEIEEGFKREVLGEVLRTLREL